MNWIRRYRDAIALVAPLLAFFLLGALLPHQLTPSAEADASVDPAGYLILVIARVLVMGAILGVYWRVYLSQFPFRVDRRGLWVGLLGGGLWIGICSLKIESAMLAGLGIPESVIGSRSGVDPQATYPSASTRGLFLAFRFLLLVGWVPIAEELFLRGFVMRIVDTDDWRDQPLGEIGRAGWVAGTVYGILTHPSEFVAAAVWFSLVTWLMVRTGRFWNCVQAHIVTNLILGIYIYSTGSWWLW